MTNMVDVQDESSRSTTDHMDIDDSEDEGLEEVLHCLLYNDWSGCPLFKNVTTTTNNNNNNNTKNNNITINN